MQLVVIAHNIRSTHNVGAIFRTCEGFGVQRLYLTGYTPHPKLADDSRLPHLAEKLTAQIHKTALGAEALVPFSYFENPETVIANLKHGGFTVTGLEQTNSAVPLPNFKSASKTALVLGEEVAGIPAALQALCDNFVEIPMRGQKESFNVSIACGIALYGLTSQNA